MRRRPKGSALLWAVLSLLIVMIIVTGILALNKSYAAEEISIVASRRAEYYARSGIELTADLIQDDRLTQGKSYDDISHFTEVIVTYDWGSAKVERTSWDKIRIISTASAGDSEKTLTGIMTYSVENSKWGDAVYATN